MLKHTLEYDNVLNIQRTSIYSRRRKMLEADMNEVKGYVGRTLLEIITKLKVNRK